MSYKYRFRMYESLQNQREQILKDARKAADDIGIPADLRGNIGLTAAGSNRPGLLRSDIIQAISKAARKPKSKGQYPCFKRAFPLRFPIVEPAQFRPTRERWFAQGRLPGKMQLRIYAEEVF